MSFDLALNHICPHRVVKERLTLDNDRRSLRCKRPPSSSQVDLWVNMFHVQEDNSTWGYTLTRDETRIDNGKKVYFNKLIQSQNDLFEFSYFTTPNNCRRCASTRIENDLYFDTLGRVVIVRDEEKLLQDQQKFVVTIKNSNLFHPFIGTRIVEAIGAKITDSDFSELTITQEIVDVLDSLKELQLQQQRYQVVTDREFLFRVLFIDVQQSKEDPSVFNLLIVSVNRAGETSEFEQSISIPGPQDLLYGDPRKEVVKDSGFQRLTG